MTKKIKMPKPNERLALTGKTKEAFDDLHIQLATALEMNITQDYVIRWMIAQCITPLQTLNQRSAQMAAEDGAK